MPNFQQKTRVKKFLYSKTALLILLVLVILVVRATYQLYQKEKLSGEDYASIKQNYDSLNERKSVLESEIAKLKTEEGMEEEIRSKFNMAKPGETVVVVVDKNATNSANNDSGISSLWQKVLNWFNWSK